MTALAINQFLVLYMWFALAALLLLMLLIGRFYQNFSGARTFFRLFVIPIVLFGIGSVRYTSIDQLAGDRIADLLFGTAGALLIFLSVRLYWIMVIRRKDDKA